MGTCDDDVFMFRHFKSEEAAANSCVLTIRSEQILNSHRYVQQNISEAFPAAEPSIRKKWLHTAH